MPARRFIVIGVMVVLTLGAAGVWWLRKPPEQQKEAVEIPADGFEKPPARGADVDSCQGRARLVSQLGHSQAVTYVAIFPDGKKVLTGSEDGACVWDVDSGR